MREWMEGLAQIPWITAVVTYLYVPLMMAVGLYNIAHAIVPNGRFTRGRFVASVLWFAVARGLVELANVYEWPVGSLIQMGTAIGACALFYGERRWRDILTTLKAMLLFFLCDISVIITYELLGVSGEVPGMWAGTDVRVTYTVGPLMFVWNVLYAWLWKRLSGWFRQSELNWFYLIAGATFASAFVFVFLPTDTVFSFGTQYQQKYSVIRLVLMSISMLLGFGLVAYGRTHRLYRTQLRVNHTLEEQQSMYEALMADQRMYRHNLMNMLYGLDGQLYSGDMIKTRAYYDELIEKTRLINNENIISLQRLPSMAMRGLLLRQIELARQARVPFYLFAEPLQGWSRMKESDSCELMGVLLDNAREAAIPAQAPFVSVELRNAQDAVEWVIRNTYDTPPNVSEMERDGYTTKDNGGIGLKSVRRMLAKYPKVQMHTETSGQYLVQHLLLPWR